MKRISLLWTIFVLILTNTFLKAQMSGAYSVPSTFTSIAAAINSLNAVGVSAAVTINIAAGYTETAVPGGYSLNTITGASSSSQVIFRKNGTGVNPIIYAYGGGTATPIDQKQDGFWRLIGADWITIDGIDLWDANFGGSPDMEFGYGLFKASAANGCQNNTIKNCAILMRRSNNAFGTGTASDGSRGIEVVNALTTAHTTSISVTSAAGSNSYNKFYSNYITDGNISIALVGYATTSPFTNVDMFNDIGGSSTATGNTFINFGGGGTAAPAAGIQAEGQYSLNVRYNWVDNNANGTGVNHPGTLRGIYLKAATSASAVVSNNTISVRSAGSGVQLTAIENASGSTPASNAITIANNLITACSYTGAISGVFTGILSTGSPATLNITGNQLVGNSTAGNGGGSAHNLIYNTGAVGSAINITNNHINGFTFSGPFNGAVNYISNVGGSSTATLSISGNTLSAINHTNSSNSSHSLVLTTAPVATQSITNNVFNNLSLTTTGPIDFISNSVAMPSNGLMLVAGNRISGTFSNPSGGGYVVGINNSAASVAGAVLTYSNNNFSNITVTGNSSIFGVFCTGGAGATKIISANTFTNWTTGTQAIIGFSVDAGGNNSSISSNTISNIYAATGAITGIAFGALNTGTTQSIQLNTISNFTTVNSIIGLNILASSVQTLNVVSNTIRSITTSFFAVTGLQCASTLTNVIRKNKIYNLQADNTSLNVTATGMRFSGGTETRIYNNLVGDLRTPAASSGNPVIGINIINGSVYNIIHNTVYIDATGGLSFGSTALNASTSATVNLMNNILINKSTPGGSAHVVAYRRTGTSLSTYAGTSDNNVFYAGSPLGNRDIFYDGTNSYTTLAQFQAVVSPRDINSKTENTPFTSTVGTNTSFLHINTSLSSLAESGGVMVPGISDDFDADIRANFAGYLGTGGAPDIGADEYEPTLSPCASANGGSLYAASTSTCSGQTLLLRSSGFSAGSSSSYQWRVSSTPGGPYTNVSGGIGANTTGYIPPALGSGTLYYVMTASCGATSTNSVSTEFTLVVHPTPSASISVSGNTICMGQSFSLNVLSDAGTTFIWTGPNGFSSNVQNPSVPSATIASAGIYSVVVSTSNCTAAVATVSTAVLYTPDLLTVTPNSTVFCAGTQQTLVATGGSIPTFMNIGTNTTMNGAGAYPAPYSVAAGGQRMQFLVLASELAAAGFVNGSSLTNLQFPVVSKGTNWGGSLAHNQDFKMSMGHTALSSLSSFQTGLTTVVAANNFSPAAGYANTHIFSPAFVWNGTSNVVIETAFSNSVTGSMNDAVIQYSTSTSFGSTIVYAANNVSSATIYTTTTISNSYNARPDFRINGVSVANFSWTPSTGLSSTTGSSVNATPLATTIYTVRSMNGSCYSSDAATISVNPVPTVGIAQSVNTVCAGSPVTFTASGAVSYGWIGGPTTATHAASPSATTIYTVNGTNAFGCSGTRTTQVTVHQYPVLGISPVIATVCLQASIVFTASGASTYLWNGTLAGNTATFTPIASTVYALSGTSPEGCTTNTTIAVTSIALPTVQVAQSSPTVCYQGAVTFTANGAATYTWLPNFVSQTQTVNPTANTVYTVTGTSVAGCNANGTVAVNVLALPVVTVTPQSVTVCASTPVSFTAAGANTYSWTGGTTSAGVSYTPVISGFYTVTGTDLQGCKATTTVAVTSNSLPIITVTGPMGSVCPNTTFTLNASGAGNYIWNIPATGATVTLSLPSNTVFVVSGTHTLTGCPGSATLAVSTRSLPVISVSPASATICANTSVSFTASGVSTYTWSGISGSAASVTVSPAASTVYTLSGTDQAGCTGSASVAVNVNAAPQVIVSVASLTVCNGESITLNASGANTYSWLPSPSTGAQFTVIPAAGINYTVTGTAANACEGSATVAVIVDACTSLRENALTGIQVYPNPSNGKFIANFGFSGEKVITIRNMAGALIAESQTNSLQQELDLSGAAKGIYMMRISASQGTVHYKIVLD